MTYFSAEEIDYLVGQRRIGRLATLDPNGQPHVVPVGWRYNLELGTIDISGHALSKTRKFRNVQSNPRVAIVVDDIVSTDPWHPRAVMIQGEAQPIATPGLSEESSVGGMIRITANKVLSWGL